MTSVDVALNEEQIFDEKLAYKGDLYYCDISDSIETNHLKDVFSKFNVNEDINLDNLVIEPFLSKGINKTKFKIDYEGKSYILYRLDNEHKKSRRDNVINAYNELEGKEVIHVSKHYKVFNTGDSDGNYWLLKEYIPGKTLSEYLNDFFNHFSDIFEVNNYCVPVMRESFANELIDFNKKNNCDVHEFDYFVLKDLNPEARKNMLNSLKKIEQHSHGSLILQLYGSNVLNLNERTRIFEKPDYNYIKELFINRYVTCGMNSVLNEASDKVVFNNDYSSICAIDLKPENLVIGTDGKLHFIDLDSFKRTNTFTDRYILFNTLTVENINAQLNIYSARHVNGLLNALNQSVREGYENALINCFPGKKGSALNSEITNACYSLTKEVLSEAVALELSYALSIRNILMSTCNEKKNLGKLLKPLVTPDVIPRWISPEFFPENTIITDDTNWAIVQQTNDVLFFNLLDGYALSKKKLENKELYLGLEDFENYLVNPLISHSAIFASSTFGGKLNRNYVDRFEEVMNFINTVPVIIKGKEINLLSFEPLN